MESSNLPVQLTSFIGRRREMAELQRLLLDARLVTLVGAGGCGKTRLALRVAGALSDPPARRVFWVDLTRLADPMLLLQTVAKAVDVQEQAGRPLLDALLDALSEGPALLVVDNCEHLLAASAQVVEALAVCPDLTILATSREPLGVPGETLYPVAPLALPAAHLSADQIGEVDSVRLFVERARGILPHFALTPENAASVATICRVLDGIPLAIELASARVNVLSLEQIQERLDRRLDFLVASARAEARHRTLRAVMDWSYELLSALERTLLQRLALFAASFTLSTAEAVGAWGDIRRDELLDLLTSLVSKSLVTAETLHAGEARYRLRETIRQYAREKLAASADWTPAHDRYVACVLELAEEIAPKLRQQYQQLWFDWLETENDNIRAALTWALEGDRIESGLRIANALWQFWAVRGYWQEGLAWFERLLARTDDRIPVAVHANACTHAAFLAEWRGNSLAAIGHGRRGVEVAEAAGDADKAILGFALGGLASAMKMVGDYQAVYTLEGQYNDLFRALGDAYTFELGMGVLVQGQTATVLGKYDAARSLLDEALALARAAGDPYRTAIALGYSGDLARCQRQDAQALVCYEEAAALLRELGAERDLAGALQNLGHTCLHFGDMARAEALFDESMALQQAQRNAHGMAECLVGYAALAVARGLPAAGARLLAAVAATGWVDRAREWPATYLEYEQTLALARVQLTDAEFEAEQAAGRVRSLEQMAEDARRLSLPPLHEAHDDEGAEQILTAREREVVILIAQGLSNAEIAEALVLSKRTVEKHIANILSKLGLTSRAQVVRWTIAQGLLDAAS